MNKTYRPSDCVPWETAKNSNQALFKIKKPQQRVWFFDQFDNTWKPRRKPTAKEKEENKYNN